MKIKEKNNFISISFNYDAALVAIVGGMRSRKFSSKSKEWIIPKSNVSEVVETLEPLGFEIDEKIKKLYIKEKHKKQKIQNILNFEFNKKEKEKLESLNLPLFNFQKIGTGFLCVAKSALLGDEPGLGKSIQSISCTYIKNAKKVLILCPGTLKLNWSEEIKKWFPNKKITVISGNKKEREKKWTEEDSNYIIINYELLIRDIKEIKKIKWDFIIADEATRIANPKAKQSKEIKKIKADYKIALTGTPLNNAIEDLWNIIDFCKPGLLGSFWQFTERYCVKDRWRKIISYKNLNELKSIVQSNMIRRKKIEVLNELPEKVYENIYIEMSQTEKEVYEAIKEEIQKDLEKYQIEKVLDDKYLSNIVVKMVRLKQATDSLELVSNHKISSKLESLKELLKDILHNESKTIIFTQFSQMADILKKELSQYNPLLISGKINNEERQQNVNDFQSNEKNKIMIMTEAGSYGLNMQKASYIIHYDLPWSISKMEQREGRAHRIGQKNSVIVFNLITLNSIDEYVYKVLMKKQKLSEDILGDKERVRKVKISKKDINNILN